MKTLHVDTGREMHGGQWQVVYLLERLNDAILLARGPFLDEARRRGIDARPFSFLTLTKLARQSDLVHAHDARAHTLAILAGGPPLVVSRRVAFPINSRWKYTRAAMYLAISNFVSQRLQDAGVPQEKIRVVYDGVPIPENPTTATGGVLALPNKCAEAVRASGIPIQFTTNLWPDLETAKIFVYESEMEGLGSAVLAAMAAGVPVIASPVGGIPEAVEHERTGLLVRDGDFATPLRRLLDNPTEAAEMGRRARDLVKQKFSADQMTDSTQRAYDEVFPCR